MDTLLVYVIAEMGSQLHALRTAATPEGTVGVRI